MGRWAQRRLRGGGVTPAAPAVPAVISVAQTAPDSCLITFDHPITVNGAAADGSFDIGGIPCDNLEGVPTQAGVAQAQVSSSDWAFAAGETWTFSAQPPWITETIVTPASGTTI
jgi:hypothetical protein